MKTIEKLTEEVSFTTRIKANECLMSQPDFPDVNSPFLTLPIYLMRFCCPSHIHRLLHDQSVLVGMGKKNWGKQAVPSCWALIQEQEAYLTSLFFTASCNVCTSASAFGSFFSFCPIFPAHNYFCLSSFWGGREKEFTINECTTVHLSITTGESRPVLNAT